MHDLLVEHAPERLVLEIGPTAGWICDLAVTLGVPVQVANTNHAAWRWKNVKKKNDRQDALKLAQLSAMNQLTEVHMPSRAVRQTRALLTYRHTLVARRTAIKNHIRALLDMQGLSMPSGKKGWSQAHLRQLKAMARPLAEVSAEDYWRGELELELGNLAWVEKKVAAVEEKLDAAAKQDSRIQRLKTIPGVGNRLAEVVVAVIDDPHRFDTGKEVGSYAGLTPRQYQSGSMDRQGRISKEGNPLLRMMLVEVGWLMLRWNPWAKATYVRLHQGNPKRKKKAMVAVARKLLMIMRAMLLSGEVFNESLVLTQERLEPGITREMRRVQ